MATRQIIMTVALMVATLGQAGTAEDDGVVALVEHELADGRRLVVTRRKTDFKPRSAESRREIEKTLPPGVTLEPSDTKHEFTFTIVGPGDGARAVAWSTRIATSKTWPEFSQFTFIDAAIVDPGVLVLVYSEGIRVHVNAVDVRPQRDEPLGLPTSPEEVVRAGSGVDGIFVDAAEVRGSAADGSLTVLLTGRYSVSRHVDRINGRRHGVIARAALGKGDDGLRWTSEIEAVGAPASARKRASPAEVYREAERQRFEWFKEVPLAGGDGVLAYIRHEVSPPNTKPVDHHYEFWLKHPDGERQAVPWRPTLTDAAALGHKFEVIHAARVDDGYLAVVFRHGRDVRARVIDLRAPVNGRGRLDPGGHDEAPPIQAGEGVDVSSASVAGSLAEGTLTVKVRATPREAGARPKRLASAPLAKEGGAHRWRVSEGSADDE